MLVVQFWVMPLYQRGVSARWLMLLAYSRKNWWTTSPSALRR
ncbi:MAG: hypothetical protein AAGA92_01275 [Planctomycetota bacterium]